MGFHKSEKYEMERYESLVHDNVRYKKAEHAKLIFVFQIRDHYMCIMQNDNLGV